MKLRDVMKEAIRECEFFGKDTDLEFINAFKMILATKADESSYQEWMNRVVIEVAQGVAA